MMVAVVEQQAHDCIVAVLANAATKAEPEPKNRASASATLANKCCNTSSLVERSRANEFIE